jgi:hypothetical protein
MVQLRPVLVDDVKYFATWWRDDSLIVLTSGNHAELSNNQLEKYFREILEQDRNREMVHVASWPLIFPCLLLFRNEEVP